MVSCVDKISSSEGNYSHGITAREKISREKALDIAKNSLLNKGYINAEEKTSLFDNGNYYTVTVALPPLAVGGGWTVDLDCYSGEIMRIYFAE